MTSEHAERRFGGTGEEVGRRAARLLTALSDSVPSFTPDADSMVVWSKNDFGAFENLVELETGIRFIAPRADVPGEEIGDLSRAFARFHTSLPITEAERYWLIDPIENRTDRTFDLHYPATLLDVTEEVVSGGRVQVIEGREVIRRLSAWRRQTDEFEHERSLDDAREALGVVATMLASDAASPQT